MKKLLNNPAVVGAVLLLLILCMLVTCNKCNGLGVYQPEVRKRDTVYLTVSDSTGWIRPALDTVIRVKWKTVYRDGKRVQVYVRDTVRLDAAPELLFDTTSSRLYVYNDTVRIDTAGITGQVVIRDTAAGPIVARNVVTYFKIPTITSTVTRQRVAVYWGPVAQFSRGVHGVGLSAHWQTRGGLLLNGGVLFDAQGRGALYQAGAAFKIRLK